MSENQDEFQIVDESVRMRAEIFRRDAAARIEQALHDQRADERGEHDRKAAEALPEVRVRLLVERDIDEQERGQHRERSADLPVDERTRLVVPPKVNRRHTARARDRINEHQRERERRDGLKCDPDRDDELDRRRRDLEPRAEQHHQRRHDPAPQGDDADGEHGVPEMVRARTLRRPAEPVDERDEILPKPEVQDDTEHRETEQERMAPRVRRNDLDERRPVCRVDEPEQRRRGRLNGTTSRRFRRSGATAGARRGTPGSVCRTSTSRRSLNSSSLSTLR